jgi:hypothetical protein
MFKVYWSVHRKYIPIYIQQDATLNSIFIFGNCSTCFGWYFHPSSKAHTTVSTASGICHTVTVICRYRGRVGTGLSVVWVAYANHTTLKPISYLPKYFYSIKYCTHLTKTFDLFWNLASLFSRYLIFPNSLHLFPQIFWFTLTNHNLVLANFFFL